MFTVKRLVGDSHCDVIAKVEDIEKAMQLADENAYDEEPDEIEQESEDFSWENYEGLGEVVDDEHDCILYWCNGDGKTGTDLSEEDEYYNAVMKHISPEFVMER